MRICRVGFIDCCAEGRHCVSCSGTAWNNTVRSGHCSIRCSGEREDEINGKRQRTLAGASVDERGLQNLLKLSAFVVDQHLCHIHARGLVVGCHHPIALASTTGLDDVFVTRLNVDIHGTVVRFAGENTQ